MNREKTLIKNTIIYAIGNFGSKILSFLLVSFYTFYLSTNDYGYFDLITTTTMLLIPIITFEICDGVYRYLLDVKDKKESMNLISNSFFITIKNVLIFSLAYLIFIKFKSFKYEYLILIQIDLGILSGLWAQISRGLRKNIEYAISGILAAFVTLSSNIIFITILNLKVGSLITSNILASLIVIIYLDYKLKIHKYIKINYNNKIIKKKLIIFSVPLIPNVISWWFMNVSDRYFLTFYKGLEANGIYAIANKFPSIIIMLNSIFYLAWQESAISEYNSNDRDNYYTKMFNILVSLEFSSVIGLLAFTKFIMKYMVSVKFFDAWMYIPFLYIGTIFSIFSAFYGTGYLSSKNTVGAFYTSIVGGFVNIILNIILIPTSGIQGASFSTMVSFLVMWILRLWQTRKYFRVYIDFKKLMLLLTISILFIKFYYINSKIIEIMMMISSIVIFLLFNKDIINKIVKLAINNLINKK